MRWIRCYVYINMLTLDHYKCIFIQFQNNHKRRCNVSVNKPLPGVFLHKVHLPVGFEPTTKVETSAATLNKKKYSVTNVSNV